MGLFFGFVGDFGAAGLGEGIQETGFVNDAGKFFDDSIAVKFFRISNTDKREMSTAEEFFHIFEITIRGRMFFVVVVVDFDGANGADGTFVAEDEISSFVLDKTVSFSATLATDFMIKERAEGDVRYDVETFAEDFVEGLETMFLGASHELFFRTVMEAFDGFTVVAFINYTDENRNNQKDE